ncbi:MAG TPA: hypothetical protein VFE15_07225 [Marmoricola sp.]|jgi:hypothetical protein|nr:hypothetical protein [Marmoricola sp.]
MNGRHHGKRSVARIVPVLVAMAAAVLFSIGAADASSASSPQTASAPAHIPDWVPLAGGGLLVGGGVVLRRALADSEGKK